ncbi:hypothetical protein V6N11_005481 [Hibiscus sabdariffa]|uniref:Uncharacterized protein n=2 Tax=Hibiscus sabdariffa TaxID=183260 RepID=A0ABR1ZX66_9ROSI
MGFAVAMHDALPFANLSASSESPGIGCLEQVEMKQNHEALQDETLHLHIFFANHQYMKHEAFASAPMVLMLLLHQAQEKQT